VARLLFKAALWVLALFLALFLSSCEPSKEDKKEEQEKKILSYIQDFKKIPGITPAEVNAIEGMQARGMVYSYGTLRSSEAFENETGEKAGFLIDFSKFLTELLGLGFDHNFYERGELEDALAAGWLDFASEVEWQALDSGRDFYLTDPIYERIVKVYKNKSLGDLRVLSLRKVPRFGFMESSGIRERVLRATSFQVETVVIHTYPEAAMMLMDGSLDAFFEDSSVLSFFDAFYGIVSEDYFPPIDLPLSLGTGNEELTVIISIVQKFLEAGGNEYLSQLYAQSSLDNLKILFENSLTKEERLFLDELIASGQPVRVAAEADDYPVSFYNHQTEEFQGIAHDVLTEITEITGIPFAVANGPELNVDELKGMVVKGEAELLSSFSFMLEDGSNYILTPRPHSHDRFALLTTLESPEIKFNQIFYGTVGLVRGDDRSDLYRQWFPHSNNIIYYRSLEKALEALKRHDIMYVMGSSNMLLAQTNYREDPSFKVGLYFEYPVPSGFAFNQNCEVLASIFAKGMNLVQVELINQRWNTRMFDYNRKFIRDTIPYFVLFAVLLLLAILGLIYENRKNKLLNKNLELIVDERSRTLLSTQVDLEQERQLFKRILDSCPICFTISKDGLINFLTPFAENFFGKKIGENLIDRFAVKEEYQEAQELLHQKKAMDWKPMKVKNAAGQIREVLVNAFVSDYYGTQGIMTWYTDVTELKENARDLALAKDIAEDSAKAKSEFLANMSHEIRTPMNAIMGLTQLTLQSDLNDLQRDYLDKIATAAKSLLGIINDILDFSKIEAGKLSMERIDFQLETVIDSVINVVSVKANEKNLELLCQVTSNTPTNLVGDPLRLGQILNNLMSNAVKFTEKGRVTLSVEALEETSDQTILQFQLQDTGIGMTDEERDRLFAAFNQADTSVTRRFGGTGLGLAISKRLVEMMGGKIWCESKLGEGSSFFFTAIFGIHDQKKRYSTYNKDFSKYTALAVDDYEPALIVISEELKALGFNVISAESGQRALEILEDSLTTPPAIDLVILDWKMPVMDGLMTASLIQSRMPRDKLPIMIVATAHDHDEISGSASKLGIRKVITKPVLATNLQSTLTDCLRQKPKALLRQAKKRQAMDASKVAHLKGSLILLAEDNEVNQLVAKKLLMNAGFQVDIANNGREAFDKVQSKRYSLVLMDIQMPEMDGLTATRAIRALPGYEKLPIVAMTAHAMSGDRDLSLAAGMNDHITKPINLDDLFNALDKWITPETTAPEPMAITTNQGEAPEGL
jgi:signal transduction histidine kinase/DNA-binding response OmpR family regulator/ABC-type amino acid transport substrate-binding protein